MATTSTTRDLGQRARTLAVVVGTLALATLLGPVGLVGILLGGTLAGLAELGRLRGLAPLPSLALAAALVAVAAAWAAWGVLPSALAVGAVCLGVGAVGAAPTPLLRGPGLLLMVGGLIVLPALVVGLQLSVRSPLWLAVTFALLQVHDIAAYLVGRRFGRIHPLPGLSPGKSLAGFAGGAAALALAVVWARGSRGEPVWSPSTLVLVGAMVAVAALGDLAFSWIKRRVGASDFGDSLPGHGGILDRFDNTVVGLPVFALLIDRGLLL